MKAISIRQPWANKIAYGPKTIETRTWYTKYRGPLMIHSSKKPAIKPAGCAIAVVTLLDCRRMTKGDEKDACCPYYPGAYSFVFGKRWTLPHPIYMSGALYIYDTEKLYQAPLNQLRVIEQAYLSNCHTCDHFHPKNLGKGSICSKQDGCPSWYNAKKNTLPACAG